MLKETRPPPALPAGTSDCETPDVTEHVEGEATAARSSVCRVPAPQRDFLSSFSVVAGGCALLLLSAPAPLEVTPDDLRQVAALWLTALGAGRLGERAGAPPLLGALAAGVALRNVAPGLAPPPGFGAAVERVGLAVILLLSSTELDVGAVARAGGVALRLTCLPGLAEAAAAAAAARGLLGLPPALALALGFLLAAVSPAIVLPGMTTLQRRGHGVASGLPSVVMAACALDDVVAITGYSVAVGVALDGRARGASASRLALSAFLHGPVAVLLGVAAGCAGGVALAATRSCPRGWQRTAAALELALLASFGFKRVGLDGSGAVA